MKMAKLFTGLLIAISSTGLAQNFHANTSDTTFYGSVSGSDFYAMIDLYNDSTASFPISWEVTSANLETNWDYSVCDPGTCYPIGTVSSSFNLPTTANNRVMNVHYYPNGTPGQSTVTVKLTEDAYPNDPIYLTWTGIVSTASVESKTQIISFTAFPNPAKDVIKITYNFSNTDEQTEIILYNALGEQVSVKTLTSNSGTVKFDDNLPNGMYFYSINSGGEILATKKIVLL
jgi:hypothetical protein